MKPTPISDVLRRVNSKSLTPLHKVMYLRAEIAASSKRSLRRHELEMILKEIVNKQLKREMRGAA